MTRYFATAAMVVGLITSSTALSSAETFRWATTTDPRTLDPHAQNSAPVLSFLNNVYEGLVRRNQSMEIEPSLATRWEALPDGAGWRFHLREGVTFQGGEEFTAEDVLFSYERASSPESDTASWFAPVSSVEIVDDFTIDFLTTAPNPIFPGSIANFMILDKGWAEANDASLPAKETETYASFNANGTGPFMIQSREPDTRTVLVPNPNWWDEATHSVTEAIYTPIQNSATALAALISGEVDLINPVPIQDVDRLKATAGVDVFQDEEARVIMLGFKHKSDTLLSGEPNPFLDARVRQAVYQAINVDAIIATIMRGSSVPASQLVSSEMRGYSEPNSERLAYDPSAATALLGEAGYPDGFSFELKCPNNRYINDESVCQAVVSMLAAIGVTANLTAMPVANYWPELREDNFDMYLLGWSPGTFDAEHPIRFLASTPNAEKRLGSWNFGGYSNAAVDDLLPSIQGELDESARQAMLDEVAGILQDEVAYVTLYTEPLVWGVSDQFSVVPRADNFFMLRWVTAK